MTLNTLPSRMYFNFKLYQHCKEISSLYKKNTFHECLELISSHNHLKTINISEDVSATYLSKRVRLINRFLGANNCLANSMCLFLAIKNRENLSFIVGVEEDFLENSFSHCWIEINNIAINENKSILNYKPIITISI